jgi:hypothetical protein
MGESTPLDVLLVGRAEMTEFNDITDYRKGLS